MKTAKSILSAVAPVVMAGTALAGPGPAPDHDIRLVLQVTVDGLRADLLDRYRANFGERGFRYLLDNGVVYADAQYQHANTETIVGHATLATGTYPSRHGMVGNVWFDREAGELAYNIEDPDSPILPTRGSMTEGGQLDPAQKKSRTQGRSPSVIAAPTFADGLAAYYGGRSKVFAVSGKDRSAVAMGGQVGKAFWFSTDTGDFVTSAYYYADYPDWARAWNERRRASGYAGTSWLLLNERDQYLLGDQDDRPYEVDLQGYGRVFPHPFGRAEDRLFFTRLLVSPVVDRLMLDFAKELVSNEQLGQDAVPDYLSVSFSGVDAVNHFFGPSSLENEDVVLQLDRTLAELVGFIGDRVGLEHTLIVLSADHGMADMPEYMSELGFAAGRLEPMQIVGTANAAARRAGVPGAVRFFYRPYLYLDDDKIAAAGVDRDLVERTIADALTDMQGVELAVATSRLPDDGPAALLQQVANNHHATRSGDVYVIQSPYWFLFDEGPIAAMHGSPWRYDTHVPIVFAGPGIERETVHRPVHPVDVAPTLARLLGMSPPASARGTPLREVLD